MFQKNFWRINEYDLHVIVSQAQILFMLVCKILIFLPAVWTVGRRQ